MIKAFCVAEHTFHLEMPGDSAVWPLLTQYEPFETAPVGDPDFILSIVGKIEDAPKEPFYSSEQEDEGQPRLDLYVRQDGFLVEMAPLLSLPICGRMLMTKDFRAAKLEFIVNGSRQALFSVNNALMVLFAFRTAPSMTLEMHASVILNEGRGYLFLGKSGTGKSTHSRMWLNSIEGSELLNDDNPIVGVDADGVARVYGSPWSGKTPCYRNISAPIGAFVRIRQAKHNTATKMNILEAYASIFSSCSGLKADPQMSDDLHRSLEFFALNVPCYFMDCLPDEDAARVCAAAVKGAAGNE